jgi:hypothetical protein
MLNKVTCVFIDSDGRTYRKRVGIVNGLAPVTINGRSCVYDVGSSRFMPPTFKVGCSAPLDASNCYSTFTITLISAGGKGRADFVRNSADTFRNSSLLDCIDNGLRRDMFTLVSVSVLKGEGLYDFALEKGVIEGDFVVFTDDVIRELRQL